MVDALPMPRNWLIAKPQHFVWLCIFIVIVTRILELFAIKLFVGEQYSALEYSAASQNMGMAYLFKFFAVGRFAYLALLCFSYKERKYLKMAFFATLMQIFFAVQDANRAWIIIVIMINFFMYDKYVKKVNYAYCIFVVPVFVFIISFFGYVRDFEVGGLDFYLDTLGIFFQNIDLALMLFMNRMDILPTLTSAADCYFLDKFDFLYGSSYLNSILHFVPRSIWSDKPLLTAAYVTSITNPGAFSDGVNYYCTVFWEGFLNLFYLGPILSGFLVGALSRYYDRLMQSSGNGSVFVYVIFFTFPMGLVNEGFHSNYIGGVIYNLFLLFFLLFLFKKSGLVRFVG